MSFGDTIVGEVLGQPSKADDINGAPNRVAEGAAVNTSVGITAHSTFFGLGPVFYSLSGDTSGGGFKINFLTGVVTVDDPSKIDFESSPGHAYTITVRSTFGIFSNTQTFTIGVDDVAPSVPVDSNAAANTVLEGAANGTAVGITASSTDVNGPAVTYALIGDTSGGGFTINAATGAITVADSTKIDYESSAGHAYTVTVQSSDGTLTSSQTFTINVGDVAPTTPVDTNAAANTVTEAPSAGSAVGITVSSVDPNGPASTYSLIGDTSGGGFTINASTGVVTVADPTKIDYESSAGHAYSITVRATNGAQTTQQTFNIAVTDVAPSAPIDTNGAANTVAEGAANGTTVGITAFSGDLNGPAVTYSLIGDTSGGGFGINVANGLITVADGTKINYETAPGHAYTVTAQASDGTLTNSQSFTIAVSDVAPSAPVDSDGATNTVLEGAANGTAVGITASSTDVNGGAVTYSLIGDTSGGGFTINATTGVITVADGTKIDYESSPGHAYTVTAQAGDGTLTTSQAFTINVGDVAMTTPVDTNAGANSVTEAPGVGTTVGITAQASDPNGPATIYSLIGDTSGGGFTINASTGVVTVADPSKIDYESSAGHAYNITVRATSGAQTTQQSFNIAVTDIAPSAPIDTNGAANTVAEGAANGTTVGITAFSGDLNGPDVTYSLTGDTSGGGFTINSTTGLITVADGTKINYETAPGHAYTVTAQASDGTLTNSQTFTIAVSDVAPSAPVDSNGATNTVAEGAANGSNVGVTAFSTDVNGPGVTYSLVGDTSGGGFAINSTTGVITVADGTKLDYETTPSHAYTVTAQASDGTLTNSQAFTIALTDVAPTAPTDINGAANTIAEGAANGSTVGITASSVDPNGPATTYSLSDSAGGRFAINSSTGVVTVANGAAIDFETAAGHAYGITVLATNGALSTSSAFSIGVTDVAPSAPADANGAADSVFEGATNGTVVGITASSTDPGGGPAPTYTLSDNAGGRFAIDLNTGIVTVANGAAIDFETAPGPGHSYGITVQATAGALSSTHAFSIGVGDVNEAPAGTDKTVTMLEGDSYTFSVADFGFSDPSDSVNPNSLLAVKMTTVPGAGTGTFTNNGVTVNAGDFVSATNIADGLLVFTPAAHSNGAPEATFTFQVQDNGGILHGGVDLDQSANTVTINVNAVNDAPINSVPLATQSVNEEATLTFSTGGGNAITINDIDVGSGNETVTLTVSNGTLVLGSHVGLVSFSPDNAASITLTGTIANIDNALEGLTYTGNLDFQGADTLTVHTNDNGNTGAGGPKVDDDGISITVNDLADTPSVTNATTNEDTQSASGLVVSRNPADSSAVAFFKVTGITHGTLFQNDGTTAINNGDFITFAEANAGLKFTPAADFFGNGSFSVQASTTNTNAGLGGSLATATITVDPVADTPSVTNATTNEDTQSASGLVVSHNAVDGAEVGFVKITGITHGTLFQNDGTTAINNGDFITYAQANAGLKFTPAADFFGNGTFDVQASTSASDAGLGGSAVTATIAVSAVADTPSVTNATTNEDTQSATGLVVTHNAADGAEVGFVKITGISNGTLFQNDGTTAINNGDFITYAQANAGLKFTPAADFNGNGTFDVQASTSNADAGLGGSVQTATITVDPVNDAPALTATGNNPNYIGSPVDLFSAVTASTGPANESTQLLSKLVLTVTNISGTANDFLTIDGTQVNLTDLNDLDTGGPLHVHATVSLAGSTATVTLTSAGLSDAGMQSLVDGLSYTDVTAPGALSRVVTLTSVQDNGGTSPGVDTTTLAITSTVSFDAAPTITGGATVNYVENDGVKQVDNTIVVADTDDSNLESATVKITSGFASGQDVLNAVTAGTSIIASFSGDTLTLTGHDTLTNYQTVLRSVTYQNTSEDPSGTDRVLTTTVNDGTLDSTPITSTIHVAPVNDEPTLTATGLSPTFTENGSPVSLFSGASASTVEAGQNLDQIVLTVTNVAGTGASESLLIDGTTVALTTHSETTSTNGMTASVVLAGGTATITLSSATPSGISAAAVNTLVNALAYGNSSEDPGNANRVVTITSLRDTGPNGGPNNDDNLHTGLGLASTVTVTPVNDEPTLTGVTSLNPGFTENGAAVTLFSGGTASAVEAGQNLNNLVVTVSNVAGTGTTESLFIDGTTVALNTHSVTTATNGMTAAVSLSGGTATVTISHAGGVSAATIQGIIDGLKYGNTSENPGGATRAVTITSLSDTGPSVAPDDNIAAFTFHSDVAVTPVNDKPVVTIGATTAFSEPANGTPAANSSPVTIAPSLTITDVDSANLTQATFVLNNLKPSDALSISGHAGASGDIGGIHFAITSDATTETVTLTGTDTIANYNSVLDLVQFNNTSENPDTTARSYTVTAVDDGGTLNGGQNTGSASTTETVTAVNDAPVNTVPVEQDAIFSRTATAITGLSVSDVDSGAGETTVLSVAHGTLNVATIGGGAVVTNNGTTAVTLTGTAEQIATTLAASNGVVYTSGAFTGTDVLTVTTNDNGATGTGAHPNVVSTENLGVIPKVWFIDNTATGAEDGSQAHPFQSLASFNAATTGANDYVYLKTGTGTYSGGIVLQDGQTLIGQGDALTFPDPLHAGTLTIENAGTAPKIQPGAGVVGIDLASGNTIHGLDVDTGANGSAVAIDDGPAANSVGNLAISNLDILGAGKAIDIDHGGGTLNVTIDSLTSSGSTTQGVNLGGAMSGSFTISAGTISNATGTDVALAGNTLNFTDNGAINDSTGTAVSIANMTGGTKDFNGAITGGGIALTTNTGATVNFDGALSLSTGASNAFSASGGGTLNVTAAGNSITTTTGTALNLNGITVGGSNVAFNSVTTNGAATGISIDTVSGGSINVSGGSIAGATSRGVDINAAQTNITIGSTIGSTGSGNSVEVTGSGKAGGSTIAFSGGITDAGGGINLDNNDQNGGATINFTGALNIDSTTHTGFNATNGGTVNATNAANSINTSTGTALNVVGTTIGASNLIFHDISSNGAVNGIVLNNTGSTGHLTVTGNGVNVTNGTNSSGGQILNSTGDGIVLTNTTAPSFTNMLIQNAAGSGINANGTGGGAVNGFTFQNGKIDNTGTGGGVDSSSIAFNANPTTATNLTGAVTIVGNVLTNSGYHGVDIQQVGGTISSLNISDNTLTSSTNPASSHGSAIRITEHGTASAAANITGATINNNTITNFPNGTGILVQGGNTAGGPSETFGTAGTPIIINNNTIAGQPGVRMAGQGINFSMDGVGSSNFQISNNDISDVQGVGIGISAFGNSVNTGVSNFNTVDSNSNVNIQPGIAVGADPTNPGDTPSLTITLDHNTTHHTQGVGILALANGHGTLDATITNNTVDAPLGAGSRQGIVIRSGNGTAGEDATVFLDISGNTSAGSTGPSLGIGLRKQGTSTTINSFGIEDMTGTGASPDVENYVNGKNPTGGGTLLVSATSGFTSVNRHPMLAADGGVQASSPTTIETINQADLNSVVAAAIGQWALAGASANQIAAMQAIHFVLADLSDNMIGNESSGRIAIDIDGAGHGWFVDPTPTDNSEFTHAQNASGTDLLTDSSNAAAGHLDLLTVVTHELGHVIGLEDSTTASTASDLMNINLVDGERRLPDATDVAQANGSSAMQAEAALPVSAQAAANTPVIVGTAGNDTINAGHGGNILFGGAGADNFVFGPATPLNAPMPAQVTHVADYSAAQGDTFDFSALTSQFHNSGVSDALVVRAVEDASGKFATLQVDTINPNGLPSAPNWVNVAQLDGAHSGDAVNISIDNNHSVHLAQIHVDLLV